ncbi:MAG: transcription elongation factor GreA [Desulfarculaceae bacterium]|nr:transcription elongation factor GreA [Desulfarculaceae bacterium]MCF8071870.1 transcription elongation factor GreA [Desulfarculaceae bacterium]MCF8101420.1 transcription elongation factor GreA [Desulfarculaceae bacterium]MCF8117411.1 transcription elongation factor GreA [Desulfarculaceae bacterium]
MTRILLTRGGHESLHEQLAQLRKVELPANVKAIEEARAHGDLSENAEYHAAKERNAIIMGKIAEIKNLLAVAEVVDPLPDPNGRVVFGCKATVYDVDGDEEFSYQIVGEAESDANLGRISMTSPIGQALLGKEEGDEVSVRTPGGMRLLEIVSVE